MSAKEEILAHIRQQIRTTYDMPEMMTDTIRYADNASQFKEVVASAGGSVVELQEGEDVDIRIRELYPEGTDLAVVRGEIGVAENGCVWIPQNTKEKALCFSSEYLAILLDKTQLVGNMHEAYERITFNKYGFGVFISGPSKTADIEQALVIGAHGARGVTVVLM